MPWTLARLTDDLTDDAAWHGLALGATGAPAAGDLFVVGTGQPGAARVFDSTKILVTAGWCTADGSPLAGAGVALDLQPVYLAPLPHPTNGAQSSQRFAVGQAVSLTAWAPVYLDVGPASRATVRQSAADAGATGAARIAIWYWAQ